MATQRLYPPYIDGKLPAQPYAGTFKIPFTMNRAVGTSDFNAIQIRMRSVFTDQLIAEVATNKYSGGMAEFNLSNSSLTAGQYYKVQLAYVQNESVGYYSTVGIVKFTGDLPTLRLDGMTETIEGSGVYKNTETYFGIYTPPSADSSEKEFSYRFEVYQGNRTLYDTGNLLHKADSEKDEFTLPLQLGANEQCRLKYSVITINNITCNTTYVIEGASENTEEIKGELIATEIKDEAFIEVILQFNDSVSASEKDGKYKLWRYNIDTNTSLLLGTITMQNIQNIQDVIIYKDYELEQGCTYRYSIQRVDESTHTVSPALESEAIFVDFEDMYLYDGERQLRLRFDPKISSFKTTVLESKIDTLGGTYPIFFRNSAVKYKEFPLSALVSMLMDENEQFLSWKDGEDYRSRTAATPDDNDTFENYTNFSARNIKKEREFKLAVMDWLNNGEVKLFKSPTEGNYIVRLMNISLSPNDTLGRMIHTMSAQAYEVANTKDRVLRDKSFKAIIDPTSFTYKYLYDKDGLQLKDSQNALLVYEDINYAR